MARIGRLRAATCWSAPTAFIRWCAARSIRVRARRAGTARGCGAAAATGRAFLTGRSMVIAGGMAAKLVVYPIAEGTRPDWRLTNWAVVARIGDGSTPPPNKEDWSRTGRFEELMPHVQRFRIPYVNAQALIE